MCRSSWSAVPAEVERKDGDALGDYDGDPLATELKKVNDCSMSCARDVHVVFQKNSHRLALIQSFQHHIFPFVHGLAAWPHHLRFSSPDSSGGDAVTVGSSAGRSPISPYSEKRTEYLNRGLSATHLV